MAINATIEDFQRLGLRHLTETHTTELQSSNRFTEARAYANFERRFDRAGDTLARSDSDRAFHLVARATEIIDYRLPFVEEQKAKELIKEAKQLLTEASSLDPHCFDARRMLAASSCPSFDAYHRYLIDHASEVKQVCEQNARSVAFSENASGKLARDLAMRPYLRWLAAEATQALICGRYRCCIESSSRLIEADSEQISDAYRTLAFALVKLEDADALNKLIEASGKTIASDPWLALASLAMSYKLHHLVQASEIRGVILTTWPHAAQALSIQQDLPEGVFARPRLEPLSEDELVVAISEASVLLQEGRDRDGRGALGSWVAHEPQVIQALAQESDRAAFSMRSNPSDSADAQSSSFDDNKDNR